MTLTNKAALDAVNAPLTLLILQMLISVACMWAAYATGYAAKPPSLANKSVISLALDQTNSSAPPCLCTSGGSQGHVAGVQDILLGERAGLVLPDCARAIVAYDCGDVVLLSLIQAEP